MTPDLSIIVAARNEDATIGACLGRLLAVYPEGAEVLVVDGGCDGTGDIVRAIAAEHPQVRYLPNPDDRGKGHAIRVGIDAARAPVMAQIDADLQFFPEDLPALFAPIEEGRADVVLGSRFLPGTTRSADSTPGLRGLGNRAVSAWASLLFRQRMTDVLAGMKAWTREAADAIDLRTPGFSYEIEIPARALLADLRVVDVSVCTAAREAGVSKVNELRDGGRMLWDTVGYRFGWK